MSMYPSSPNMGYPASPQPGFGTEQSIMMSTPAMSSGMLGVPQPSFGPGSPMMGSPQMGPMGSPMMSPQPSFGGMPQSVSAPVMSPQPSFGAAPMPMGAMGGVPPAAGAFPPQQSFSSPAMMGPQHSSAGLMMTDPMGNAIPPAGGMGMGMGQSGMMGVPAAGGMGMGMGQSGMMGAGYGGMPPHSSAGVMNPGMGGMGQSGMMAGGMGMGAGMGQSGMMGGGMGMQGQGQMGGAMVPYGQQGGGLAGMMGEQTEDRSVAEGFHPADMVFKFFDKDGNGVLDKLELMAPIKAVCKKMNCPFPTKLSVDAVFKAIDRDKSGTIDLWEFREMCNRLAGTKAGKALSNMANQATGGGLAMLM
eukprot:CAMPEP_0201511566 /NCGR_PEP_ID=MMETSP0161_2-20130828/4001_1 /ASSEMBLY_ACC=CAM_ASM_000251 /TAXON_ID=180227 /ORGANISM="Neoparamoeba aestuarina, Strain SoJaBio B1-5/56/2" /LENGTH=358 /DNA_ID=CAMNT_0047907111 /DNA_START=157 /DNA_END=1233 /DNA_ORIENTATION=+